MVRRLRERCLVRVKTHGWLLLIWKGRLMRYLGGGGCEGKEEGEGSGGLVGTGM